MAKTLIVGFKPGEGHIDVRLADKGRVQIIVGARQVNLENGRVVLTDDDSYFVESIDDAKRMAQEFVTAVERVEQELIKEAQERAEWLKERTSDVECA